MNLLPACCSLLAFLFIFNLISAQECRISSRWCSSTGTRPTCVATTGSEIVIPCGGQVNQSVTYYNESNNAILADNITDCLRLNLTAFDDNKIISCYPSSSNNGGPAFLYTITVTYSPRTLSPIPLLKSQFQEPYQFDCPLVANPPPVYSAWDVFYCINGSTANPPGLSESNRTLVIESLTIDYTNVCYNCSASNELGSSSHFFQPIVFDYCSSTIRHLYLTPAPQANRIIDVIEGEDIEINCTVTSVTFFDSCVQWIHNDTLIDAGYPFINESVCIATLTLQLTNVTFNDSGNYTCRCSIPRSPDPEETIELRVVSPPEISSTNSADDVNILIPPAVTIAAAVLLVILAAMSISVILMILLHKKYKMKSAQSLPALYNDDIKDPDYDIFISFAEGDREFAETELKMNLEKKGYKVAWHHEVFVPGCSIMENMEKFIFQSRIVIALLSDHFLASEFCKKELYIALRKEKETGSSCLLPVLLNCSSEIPEVLSKKTYLSFADKRFKERLQSAIGEPQDPSP